MSLTKDHINSRTEAEVGITLRLSKCQRFGGAIKERYSDFHVNEIDPSGTIVHLTSFDLPVTPKEEALNELDPELKSILTQEILKQIEELQTKGTEKDLPIIIPIASLNKDQRTKVHRWLGNYDKVQSETIEANETKAIKVFIGEKKNKRFIRRPYNRAKYTHCVLYKEGVDTSDAVNFICRNLRLQPKNITYAGTKDKQAKTTQRICFCNIDAQKILKLNEISSQSKLGNFSYQPWNIRLGQLQGNHFKILIKNVKLEVTDDDIGNCVQSLATKGFINYFGLQRFGTYKTPTYLVGKTLIQMKWLEAFDLILQPNPRDAEFLKKAKEIWFKDRDAIKACKLIPHRYHSIESTLLHGLSKHYKTNDFVGAFKTLPRNLRTLYFHAYQSYMWNRLATFRIEEYGLTPVPGDLVLISGSEEVLEIEDDVTEASSSSAEYTEPQIKILKEEDLPSFSINDVVLPLEGTDVRFPENKVKDYFNQLLAENGMELDQFQKFRPRTDLPRGAYRRVIIQPKNVKHEIRLYNETVDCLDTFIKSDYDIINPKFKETPNSLSEDTKSEKTEVVKDKKCVIVEFSLPPSSYATMALRELLLDSELDVPDTNVQDTPVINTNSDEIEPKRIKLG